MLKDTALYSIEINPIFNKLNGARQAIPVQPV